MDWFFVLPFLSLGLGALAGHLLFRAHNWGWATGAKCERCGYVEHRSESRVWEMGDKTCPKCGPLSTWRRIVSRPVGLFGHEVREYKAGDE